MKGKESNGNANSQKPKAELRLKAQAVSRGIAVGRVVCLYGRNRQFYRIELTKPDVPSEDSVRLSDFPDVS